MFEISRNGIVTLSRGDSFEFSVFINLGTLLEPVQYFLEEGDKLYFALMEPNHPFEAALIRKVYTKDDMDESGNVIMKFVPEDTEYLLPGTYYYMVKLLRPAKESGESDKVDTIISKTKFAIVD